MLSAAGSPLCARKGAHEQYVGERDCRPFPDRWAAAWLCARSQARAGNGTGIYADMAKEQQGWGFVGAGLENRMSQMAVGANVDTADMTDTDRAVEAWQEKKRQASDDYLALGNN